MATYGAGLGLSASQHSEIFFAVKVSGTTYALKSIDKGTAVTVSHISVCRDRKNPFDIGIATLIAFSWQLLIWRFFFHQLQQAWSCTTPWRINKMQRSFCHDVTGKSQSAVQDTVMSEKKAQSLDKSKLWGFSQSLHRFSDFISLCFNTFNAAWGNTCCTGHILRFNMVGADHDLLSLHCETCGMLQQRQTEFRSLFCSVKKVTKGGHLVKPRRSISAFPLGAMSRMVGRGTRDSGLQTSTGLARIACFQVITTITRAHPFFIDWGVLKFCTRLHTGGELLSVYSRCKEMAVCFETMIRL